MEHRDFQTVISSPSAAYDEGLDFFAGRGMLNETLKKIVRDLDDRGIEYALISAVALNQHGYRRFTEDIDLLLTKEGLEHFRRELVGLGYRPAFEGARRRFKTAENVPVEIVTEGEYPGDGLPKPVRFPNPKNATTEIEGVKTILLDKLVELKLASGLSAPHRLKDLADVQELIKVKRLTRDFAEKLDPSVRDKFNELCEAVAQSGED
jgi:hypothetical protein